MSTVWPEVLMAKVSGGRVRGRLRLGWMDGVKVALSNKKMTVEAARQYAQDRRKWRTLVRMELILFHAAVFAWPCVLSDIPPVHWWLSPGEERDAVTCDAVGMNCEKGATTENQVAGVKYMGCGLYVDTWAMEYIYGQCVLSDLA